MTKSNEHIASELKDVPGLGTLGAVMRSPGPQYHCARDIQNLLPTLLMSAADSVCPVNSETEAGTEADDYIRTLMDGIANFDQMDMDTGMHKVREISEALEANPKKAEFQSELVRHLLIALYLSSRKLLDDQESPEPVRAGLGIGSILPYLTTGTYAAVRRELEPVGKWPSTLKGS